MKYTRDIRKGKDSVSRALVLPDWNTFDPKEVLVALKKLLEEGKQLADTLAEEKVHTFESLIGQSEDHDIELGRTFGPLGHLNAVMQEDIPNLQ